MKNHWMKLNLLMLAMGGLLFTACKKEVAGEEHDEEVITTLQLTFTPTGGGTMLTFQYDDPDGPGGANPTVDNITLAPNTSYLVATNFLNKTENPVHNITFEIASESKAHRLYYEPSASSGITISNLDPDAAGLPLGLTSTWQTGAAATGTVKVTLRHYGANPPNKSADDPVNSPKSTTDAEVIFNTQVE